MKILVVLKQKMKYTQEIELEFGSWGRAKDFVQEAVMSGKDISVEMSVVSDPAEECLREPVAECEKGSRFAIDTDFDD